MKTKLLVTIFIVVIALIAGCDSLWHVNDTSDIVFSIDTSTLQSTRCVQAPQNARNGVNSIDDDGSKITISLHNAGDDSEIAQITETVSEDGKAELEFENLRVVGKTVYAKAILESDGEVKEGLSEAKRMVAGENYLNISGFTIKLVDISLISIQGGMFIYQEGEGGQSNETVSSFLLGETEVTQGQWEEVMGSNPSNFQPDADLPVAKVSWYDAVEFCNVLSKRERLPEYYTINKTIGSDTSNTNNVDPYKWLVTINGGKGYRLPSEVEWEFAAGHGGFNNDGKAKARNVYAGTSKEADLSSYAVYGVNYCVIVKEGRTANALGLYDMSGNVAEWCYDWYSDSHSTRVARGGGWDASEIDCRVASRSNGLPSSWRISQVGFRVARNAN